MNQNAFLITLVSLSTYYQNFIKNKHPAVALSKHLYCFVECFTWGGRDASTELQHDG